MLSNRQQVALLRHLAVQALGAYPLVAPELRLVAHGENTTFRVDAMAPGGRDRFLLRIHRPARHGQRLDSAAAVGPELDWLTALRADTGLSVPEPLRTTDGNLTTVSASPDVPEPRVCSVLHWMDGRVHSAVPRPVHLHRLGSVMARLHNHAGQWRLPPGFARIRWDWDQLHRPLLFWRVAAGRANRETFFGDTMVYGGINAADVWDLIPGDLRQRFDRVASDMQRVMTQLGDGADQAGLIHADLHLDSALFWRGDVRVIDFDDCGFGYWLYDIAVSLWELRCRGDYGQFRAALIDGYTQHRPLPPGGLAHLDDFIATREVAFGLWYAGTAQVNPAFHADLAQVLGNIGHSLDTLIRD
jgi:Ser/Thr protein kinase RdoA (MazF antagonist)